MKRLSEMTIEELEVELAAVQAAIVAKRAQAEPPPASIYRSRPYLLEI